MNLEDQLIASTAIAKWKRENMTPTNGVTTMDVVAPTVALRNNDRQPQSITAAAAFMPVMDIDAAVKRWEAIQMFIGKIMVADLDFGVIAGSRKPSLLKPGAEKLTAFFGLAPEFDVVARIEEWDAKEPMFHYEIKCRLLRAGEVRGEGLGSCNSRESKYRNRPAVDIVNTILKMAKKRALVDAVLNTTGASQFFTQDMEDFKAPPPQPTPAPPHGTRAAQQAVAERKIAELREQIERKPVARAFPPAATAWTTRGQMREVFSKLREIVGEVEFHKEMAAAGVESPGDFQNGDAHRARTCYSRLVAIAQQEVA